METVVIVSIHAPVKGATVSAWIAETVIDVSIHAPVKGATVTGLDALQFAGFQFTHP